VEKKKKSEQEIQRVAKRFVKKTRYDSKRKSNEGSVAERSLGKKRKKESKMIKKGRSELQKISSFSSRGRNGGNLENTTLPVPAWVPGELAEHPR
jgi:hypothetical protein